MLIVNADDWGRSRAETDAAADCYRLGRITSTSAMVFMEDSERAAEVAKGCGIDVGLHLNLSQRFTGVVTAGSRLCEYHERICRFLNRSKYALVLYNPFLREQFRYVYQSQAEEFYRLFGKASSHVDGHQHMHLCSNLLFDRVIPAGARIRRSFSFFPGDKGALNRAYRRWVDGRLARHYRLADGFFSLSQHLTSERFRRVAERARSATVEIAAHPGRPAEYDFLMSDAYRAMIENLQTSTYLTAGPL